MAITIQNNPGSYFSVQGDLIFVVVDIVKANDPVTYPDYKYIADVYVGSEQVARLKAYPRPDNKMGLFNVGNILRNYVSAVFNPTAAVLVSQSSALADFFIDATMKFGEEYGFEAFTNLTVDSERRYYNHYNGRAIGLQTTLATYPNKVVSVRPAITPVKNNASFNFLPFFETATSQTVSILSYTKSGTHIGTISTNTGSSSDHVLKLLNVSPAVLNVLQPGFINTAIIGYYTVQVAGGDVYRFDLTCEPQYEVFTLHFLNRFGGFESRDFTKVSRKTIDIEKQEFGKLGYVLDSSGVVSYSNSNNVYNETRSVYSSQYKEKMTLNTDILSDAEYRWLGDLMLSPMLYIEMDGYFIPCAITEKNYEFRKRVNDKLTNITISIEFGEQFNAQYR